MKSKQYLEEIRRAAGLGRAVLKKIEVKGRTVTFFLVTDKTYSADDVEHARTVSARYAPEGFTAEVNVRKAVPDPEGIRRAVADILKTRFPAAAAFVDPEDIEAYVDEGGGRFFIGVGEAERVRMHEDGILDAVGAELAKNFPGAWYGDVRAVEKDRGEIEREAPPEAEYVIAPRMFDIEDYSPIDGANPKHAIYIADLQKEAQGVTVCGTVAYVEERATKNGKPYFSFSLTDGSAQMRCSYFSKKATVEKVREIKQGDMVCLTGDNELFNGSLSFRAKQIDRGRPPEGFVPEERPSRPVPSAYKAVFPVPVSDYVQATLFGEAGIPEDFKKREFVVFDLETTGLNTNPAMGAMDRIIELGAVKIREGRICEKLSTFVACPVRLSEEIVKITGITTTCWWARPRFRTSSPIFTSSRRAVRSLRTTWGSTTSSSAITAPKRGTVSSRGSTIRSSCRRSSCGSITTGSTTSPISSGSPFIITVLSTTPLSPRKFLSNS